MHWQAWTVRRWQCLPGRHVDSELPPGLRGAATGPRWLLLRGLVCCAVAVGVVWYCSGLGYVMSVMLEPQNSMVASVAIVLVLGGFFNGVEPRFRTLTPTMKTVFGAPSRPPLAG